MTDFSIHTPQTAPPKSKAILEGAKKAYGFVPNLMGVLAESPAAAKGFGALTGIFEKSDLSPTEQEVILMTNNRLNNCAYCMAAHTTAAKMKGLPEDVVESLRSGSPLADRKLEALRSFAAKVNRQRGVLDTADVEAFLAAGYTQANILEVIVGTALKVMSNYTNHVANTPIDGAFQSNVWSEAA